MQIDLANTLVHKVYFVYHARFMIARKLGLPSFGGVGGRFWERLSGWVSKSGEGTQTSELIIR